jgi:hypothetical protein
MNSNFDQKTSEGFYTFSGDEVFEALKMWCFQKGIVLDKNSMKSFDCSHVGSGWSVFFVFNHNKTSKKTN